MIATLGLERNRVAGQRSQRLRKGAGCNDRGIRGNFAGFCRDGAQLAVFNLEAGRLGANDFSAIGSDRRRKGRDQPARIDGVAVSRNMLGTDQVARQVWIELPEFIGIEIVPDDSGAAADIPGALIGLPAAF